ncbi:hypothetical protein HHK36_011363 [Tetracentron sinense]|uniref:Uncharacterized protein n=1 Tax=Tetracentron sinense TaxID=13715 RepID=A0A835DJT8_TETSI|nr:hypothetical protein HHK36_011363 [Tetracentron sinense]
MGSSPSSNEKLVAIGLAILSVISPLYIDRKPAIEEEEDDEPISLTSWLPLLLMVLIGAIYLSRYLDQSFKKFDPYWIHRVGVRPKAEPSLLFSDESSSFSDARDKLVFRLICIAQSRAVLALQEAAEAYLVGLLKDTNLCARGSRGLPGRSVGSSGSS